MYQEFDERPRDEMLAGHNEAQRMFEELGRWYGFEPRRQHSRGFPADGVWLLGSCYGPAFGELPVVAIEVVASESPKTILGSIATLERVGAALGIVLVQEDEIARRLVRDGASRADVQAYLARTHAHIDGHLASVRHRIERWSFEQLSHAHTLAAQRTQRTGVGAK
ncbi:hypothetical protein [Mycobacterium asiaticum]|uniref:hypothetical protein n=1 Tax=Mycobacterium asiaticum TaxID=1790 RepID=UPI0013020362|nr:hypothetical protein [Mycobacterium asiaticum]